MCWYCGSPITNGEPIGRSFICPDCGKDLRSCSNCRHYLKVEKGCAESQGENPSDRERANFCDWFGLNPKFREATGGEKKAMDAQGEAKTAFNNLFK
jgi:predicted RNA-binding Zn-ribbon protein involved in translation (DUF1610 family)